MKLFNTHFLRSLLPWLLLLMGLIVTGLASYFEKLEIERNDYRQFAFYCDEVRLKMEARLDTHKQILLSGAAMFDASDSVTRQEWQNFVQRLRSDEHFSGIQGLGFSLWVLPGQLAAHEAQIRAEGFPDYKVRPEGQREAYSSIIYLEPFSERNLRAFGYDMYSESVRRAAMEQARDTNKVALSGKVTLIQETNTEQQAGTLMYVPVYHKNQPVETVEQRRASIAGWVYSPFRMGDLLSKLMANVDEDNKMTHVHLRVYDGRTTEGEHLLYNSAEVSYVGSAQPIVLEITTSFNGTVWTLQFEHISNGLSGNDYSKIWLMQGAGSAISLLLFLLLRSYLNMRANAFKMAHQLTIQLSESEQRFRRLADSAPVMIWQSGTDKLCYYFNKVWLEFTGCTLEQEQGNQWAEHVHPDDYQRCLDTYLTAFDQRQAFTMEYRLHRHDGEYRWIIDNGVPCVGNDNTFFGYVGSCLDITERKQIEDKLANVYAELQQFTYISAHHLQEPARRLISFVRRLRLQLSDEQLGEDVKASLYFIEQSAARQSALVRDIQLYLAADQVRGKNEKVNVMEVIGNVLGQRIMLISETGAQVDYNDLPVVYMDRLRLKDVFSILLDNALGYRHPERAVQIRICGEVKAGRVIFRVIDNGMGIPEEYRERVFGVFERLQVSDNQNSTGIGLAIVRRIIESCGGSVTLQETPGGGTTVVFDLPG